MASPRARFILIALGVVVAASLWRTASVERDKHRIHTAYEQAQQLVAQLEAERTQLSQELGGARETMESQTSDLTGLQDELTQVQDRLDQTVVELASLQREHEQLRQQNTSITTQLGSIAEEKQQLEAKLSSIKELRLAIRDVRRKVWRDRLAAWQAHIQVVREEDQRQLAAGNRGFIIRDGQLTLGLGRKLQVHVLEPQSVP